MLPATPPSAAKWPKPGVKYTCPMHPEIVRDAPGACPICGMALEPMTPTDAPSDGADRLHPTHVDQRRRRRPAGDPDDGRPIVGLPLRDWIGHQTANYIEFVLATPIVLWAAQPFFKRGLELVQEPLTQHVDADLARRRRGLSLFASSPTFLPGLFPVEYRMGDGVGTYFEAAVVIVALVFLGQVLELRARERTGDAIRALLDLAPKTARRILPDGSEYDAPLENIMSGDRLRVRPGDSVPVDGAGHRGAFLGRRKHDHRRTAAGREGPRATA